MSAIESPGTTWGVNRVSFSVENNFLWVTLPSGRKLAYKDPSVAIEDVVLTDDAGNETNRFKAKKIRYWAVNHKAKLVDTTIPKWSREATYGGKLTENITQAVARDILAEAMVRADACGYNVLMHSHDELVSERADGDLDRYKKIVEHLPVWARGLPLKAGGWHGPRYKKG
jgi:DNA polymerase